MGLFDSLFSGGGSGKKPGEMPSYIRKTYEDAGLDPDWVPKDSNKGKQMYCTSTSNNKQPAISFV